ncbi:MULTISPECIES: hypothetical protein [Acinetobacter]|uniref:Uncharacterized protein n=1 Tax=Acinetobacter piscicola TaxID=2006115 RepID=A0A7S6VXC9_9GAMM|nr:MULTISPECIES: hypothetical protein [Acinetobacter]QOW46487.1 hypothetical protein G0028_11605 [Acinetobacter piscicola]QOW46967.1 hypothetical protein G0028_14290 [Acinetobacter piscicola]
MEINKEREAFEEHITDAGLVEFAGYGFEVDECDEYLHEPTRVAWDSWLIGLRRSKAQAVPEGFVLVPKLSANYLFNKVPELSFKHQDEKDTVLYHLNYMASEFKESAKQFVVLDHEKQKRFIGESGSDPYRTDFEIIEQTLKLVDLLASSTNVFQRDPKSKVYPFESENPRVVEWWRTACKIQELLTDTDPENCDFEEFKAIIEAQEQGHE